MAKPIPDGYHTITPHLVVNDGPGAIEFYKKAFGAEAMAAGACAEEGAAASS